MRRRQRFLPTVLAVILPMLLSACAMAEQYKWSGVDRIVAVSDPHGAHTALLKTLNNAGVIDAEGSWSGGSTHLVITGDLLDRGPDSRAIMDLVMRLEDESLADGGRVHLTLGNHEVMNLVGDLRYVSRSEYAAFAADETAEERDHWFQRYREIQRLKSDLELNDVALREAFDRTRPPGFFAHRQAFSSAGKYGRWLLQKPLIVVVNDTAFVHGGLPPIVGELGLDKTNDQLRAEVHDYVRQIEILTDHGLVSPGAGFYDHAELAAAALADASVATDNRNALQKLIELNDATVHDSGSPLWYRGTVGCGILTEGDVLAQALSAIGATRVVIGHTPTVTRQVLQKFGGQVIEVDTGMLNASYQGSGNALIIDGDTLSVVNESGSAAVLPADHPRRVGARDSQLTASDLEAILSNGSIGAIRVDESGRQIVQVMHAEKTVTALFTPAGRSKKVNTEVAAYRLDQLLALDMVPVTVTREIEGKQGTLQFLPTEFSDEAARAAAGQGGGAWCPLPRQWSTMYIFDALIHNEVRAANSMVYSTRNWQLLLMGHGNAFKTKRGKPQYLDNIDLQLTDAWVKALQALSDEVLAQNLNDVLDKRRLSALGKRRDSLLQSAAQLD